MMIRITGGVARGLTLRVYQAGQVRPTTDKVRQAMFNILEHRYEVEFDAMSALDLFAGSGSLGLEFLSRGGRSVTFIESHPKAAQVLRDNLKRLLSHDDLNSDLQVGRVLTSSVERSLRSPPEMLFDVIFVDPPYQEERAPEVLDQLAMWLHEEGVVVIEHAKRDLFTTPQGWCVDERRYYGDTAVSFVIRDADYKLSQGEDAEDA